MIECKLCGKKVHSVQLHLAKDHRYDDIDVESYQEQFPDAPLLSDMALKKIEERKTYMAETAEILSFDSANKKALGNIFGLKGKGVKNAKGNDIMIEVFDCDEEHEVMISDVDEDHVWDVGLLKDALLGIDIKTPTLIWGHAGTGKSTSFEQISAALGLPLMRVQHTANTEESHILGQWTVKDGSTVFELGPLPLAMKYGWLYLADEYDFAFPSVLSVYQPVMEGKSLLIKEADAENRVVKPHPNFRFVATGNTNGTGDDSGLYQGTNIQNAANYSRFGMTIQAQYMKKEKEVAMLMRKAKIIKDDAEKLVDFANELRKAFKASQIGATIGPRELIYAGMIGARKESMREGLKCSFINRLAPVDAEEANSIAQRYLG